MAKVVYEMAKQQTATHYENIEEMSAEFLSEVDAETINPEIASYWQLRINLAIAQQLSVISKTLKDNGYPGA